MHQIDLELSSSGRIKPFLLLACLIATTSHCFAQTPKASPGVVILNAPTALHDNINAHLNIAQEDCDLSPTQRSALLKKIRSSLQRASMAIGYYHLQYIPTITTDNDCWVLTLDIQAGKPILFGKIEVSIIGDGRTDPSFIDYINTLTVKPGQQLDHSLYTNIKDELSTLALSRGYFNAAFEMSHLQIDKTNDRADIIIHYDTGQRMQFGQLEFTDTILSRELIARYATFKTGDPYDNLAVSKLQQSLDGSPYFSHVRVYPKTDSLNDTHVPIQLELTPNKQRTYRFGVGADTDTGPRVRFNYDNRYVNDKGHQLNYDLTLSPIRSDTNIKYSLPLSRPAHENLDFYSGILHEETETSKKDLTTLGSAYTNLRRYNWLQTVFLNFQRESFDIATESGETDLLIPGIRWSKTQTQDFLYPLNGWRVQLQLRGSTSDIGSDVSFFQTYISGKAITSIGPGRILARIEIGATQVDELSNLPASIRFFAGGDNSVRGYDYQALGPYDEQGKIVGGTHLLVGSLEYDIRLSKQWAIAAFYDQGNAFNRGVNVQFKRGAGVGLRWLSPIGPIRIDIARALDNDNDIGFHLRMGPDL